MAARMAMMAITTSSSISVKALASETVLAFMVTSQPANEKLRCRAKVFFVMMAIQIILKQQVTRAFHPRNVYVKECRDYTGATLATIGDTALVWNSDFVLWRGLSSAPN